MADIKGEDNVDFINLVLMLNQNALINLGETPRFLGGKLSRNLVLARQNVNMIKAIADKTKNNLTTGEAKLVFRLLGELQSKYVKASGLDKPGPVKSSNPRQERIDAALDGMSNADLAKLLSDITKNVKK
ncbi:MAG: DUF1844 domain-containing protein [Spirochaetia bacterium]|nr:DUF1844 domain-containing protein [Spirochaetia bacterium]